MRAKVKNGVVFIEDQQDSSLLSILATSDALAVRPKNAEPLQKGSNIEYIPL
jgi:molybdopterin molybdotransferase|tara:strand:+ start:2549 stop:2704 length:156 start_codon:yes stop_codon:yes gene_type:complete